MPGRSKVALVSLILANLVPLVGVLYFNWNLATIIFLYWLESLVIGAINVPKLLITANHRGYISKFLPNKPGSSPAYDAALAYLIIYFMFALVVYVMMYRIVDMSTLDFKAALYSFEVFIISHAISFFRNFLRDEEYKRNSVLYQFFAPYKRVLIIAAAVLAGSHLIERYDGALVAVVALIIIKIALDVITHLFEHRKKVSG